MLTYLAIGYLAGRHIRNVGRRLADAEHVDTNQPST